jgi:hypothetical protein
MGPALGTILRIGGGAERTKVVAITDNVIPHEHRPGDKAFTRYFLNAVDACVVMSRAVKADIRTFSKEMPVAYIPHPIYDNYGPTVERDAALEQLDLPKDQHYLLFFGFIRGYKGLDLLLQAMAFPEVRTLGAKLIVAGEFYDDPEPYQQLIAGQGLEEQIILRNAYIPNRRSRPRGATLQNRNPERHFPARFPLWQTNGGHPGGWSAGNRTARKRRLCGRREPRSNCHGDC